MPRGKQARGAGGAGKERAARQPEEQQQAAAAAPPRRPKRNEPCWCGSKVKYKRCCGREGLVRPAGAVATAAVGEAGERRAALGDISNVAGAAGGLGGVKIGAHPVGASMPVVVMISTRPQALLALCELAARGAAGELRKLLAASPIVADAAKNGGAVAAGLFKDETPALVASVQGDPECMRALIEADADLTTPKVGSGSTTLYLASHFGNTAVARMLIRARPDLLMVPEKMFNTLPVHVAAGHGHADILEAILDEQSALANAKAALGRTPVHDAAQKGYVRCLKLLINQGGDIDACDTFQMGTPVLRACLINQFGRSDCLRILLENGADIDQVNEKGKSALEIAKAHNNHQCFELLKSRLAELRGSSAADAAVQALDYFNFASVDAPVALELREMMFTGEVLEGLAMMTGVSSYIACVALRELDLSYDAQGRVPRSTLIDAMEWLDENMDSVQRDEASSAHGYKCSTRIEEERLVAAKADLLFSGAGKVQIHTPTENTSVDAPEDTEDIVKLARRLAMRSTAQQTSGGGEQARAARTDAGSSSAVPPPSSSSAKSKRVCAFCGKSAAEVKADGGKTIRCGACAVERYCSRRCQVEAWPSHKRTCRQRRQQAVDSS